MLEYQSRQAIVKDGIFGALLLTTITVSMGLLYDASYSTIASLTISSLVGTSLFFLSELNSLNNRNKSV